ncbi:solute carrier family 23 protein [Lactiplantibacillus plantarum]|nr:solute carrier family 23 protein [Lactiplantibacillus plantarum]
MILVSLTTMVESTGVFFALGDITGRKIEGDDLKRGYRAEGIAVILGGLFSTFPIQRFLKMSASFNYLVSRRESQFTFPLRS